MTSSTLTGTDIGLAALGLLEKNQAGIVMGLTSHGIFLRLPDHGVVFLSTESFRGPLTVNLSGDTAVLKGIILQQAARILPGHIIFPGIGLMVDFSLASRWEAPAAPQIFQSTRKRYKRLRAAVDILTGGGNSRLVKRMTQLLLGTAEGLPLQRDMLKNSLLRLRQSITAGNTKEMAEDLRALLGLGPGLTPAGDDLIIGLLLALNRYPISHMLQSEIRKLNDMILDLAHQKTGLLSASLIACAAQGQADERLITAFDGILATDQAVDRYTPLLSDWGSTSGGAALAGVLLLCT